MTVESREKSEATIAKMQAGLGRQDLLPRHALRRNVSDYTLVCYVNNITALLLSGNHEPVPIFIARAAEHQKAHPATAESDAYYAAVTRYLSQVVYHLKAYVGGLDFDEDRIPASILNAGPQPCAGEPAAPAPSSTPAMVSHRPRFG